MATRRKLLVAVRCLLASHLTLAGLAPAVSAHVDLREAASRTASMSDEDCCAGSHPGQPCPMHHRQRQTPASKDGTCRLSCADPEAYATSLGGHFVWAPDPGAWTVGDDGRTRVGMPASVSLPDVALTPVAPPPRS